MPALLHFILDATSGLIRLLLKSQQQHWALIKPGFLEVVPKQPCQIQLSLVITSKNSVFWCYLFRSQCSSELNVGGSRFKSESAKSMAGMVRLLVA